MMDYHLLYYRKSLFVSSGCAQNVSVLKANCLVLAIPLVLPANLCRSMLKFLDSHLLQRLTATSQ